MSAMPKIKLTYFEVAARGEPIRLALYMNDVAFEDERLAFDTFTEMKAKGCFPLAQLPVLTVDGKVLCQSEAQLRYVGKLTKMYPDDEWQAAKVDEAIGTVEDIQRSLYRTVHIAEEEKKAAREKLAREEWPKFLKGLNKFLEDNGTGYFVGDKPTIADLLTYLFLKWFTSGKLDHIPTTILDDYPHLKTLVNKVGTLPKIVEWNKAHNQ